MYYLDDQRRICEVCITDGVQHQKWRLIIFLFSARENTTPPRTLLSGKRQPPLNSIKQPMSQVARRSRLHAQIKMIKLSASSIRKPRMRPMVTPAPSARSSFAKPRTNGLFRAPVSETPSRIHALLLSLRASRELFDSTTKDPTASSESRSGIPMQATGGLVSILPVTCLPSSYGHTNDHVSS